MIRQASIAALVFGLCAGAWAQWDLQNSNTTADLRGIHSIGNGVAWASGTHGTVLRTEDSGYVWQTCAVPPGAGQLDFRGVQAFDANTAVVMSSGKGELSRLYKTTDGCHSWKLVFTNPYAPDGFFDAILFLDPRHGLLFGDPSPLKPNTTAAEYPGDFRLRVTADGGNIWGPISAPDAPLRPGNGLHPIGDESAFAASNSSMASRDGWFWFATSASRVAFRRLYDAKQPSEFLFQPGHCAGALDPVSKLCGQPWVDFQNSSVPILHDSPSSGIFSISFASATRGVAVGGDYTKPEFAKEIAAYTLDGGKTWHAAQAPPHGFRSSVAYDASAGIWITVGPNGTDVSRDDGKNWRAVRPDAGRHEGSDADRNWNAISLPFVVGPKGRIGKLNESAMKR